MLVPSLKLSPAGRARLKRWEAFVGVAYPDPISKGVPWTIGWGHTQGVQPGDKCDEAQGEIYLDQDVAPIEQAINNQSTYPLNQDEFDALVDFGHNEGKGALLGSTLWRLIMQGHPKDALAEFEKWDMAGGHPVQGLLNRRLDEEAGFALGLKEQEDGQPKSSPDNGTAGDSGTNPQPAGGNG